MSSSWKRQWVEAAAQNDCAALQQLLRQAQDEAVALLPLPAPDVDINALHPEHERSALHMAAAWNAAKSIRVLIDCGADVSLADQEGATAVHLAVAHDANHALRELLRGHNDKQRYYKEYMMLLLNQRNCMGYTALHVAASNGATKCCAMLLATGLVDVTLLAPQSSIDSTRQRTALDIAMQHKHNSIALLLSTSN